MYDQNDCYKIIKLKEGKMGSNIGSRATLFINHINTNNCVWLLLLCVIIGGIKRKVFGNSQGMVRKSNGALCAAGNHT